MDKIIGSKTTEGNSINNLYKEIVDAITTAHKNTLGNNKELEEHENELKNLHEKRAALLRVKNKTKSVKLEPNLISKLIRSKIRHRDEIGKEEIIKATIEGNKKYIKNMKKKLRLENQWITYIIGENGTKIHDRGKIKKL